MKAKEYAVYLGRFSPFHKGHAGIVSKMIKKFGADNCLVIIGSSSSYNERTPYTFEERRQMVNTLFPNIKVLPLPDVQPELAIFNGDTNSVWLNEISKMEKELGGKFTFFGGSGADLDILAQKFDTEVITDRENGAKISATKVREALLSGNTDILKDMVDPRIQGLIIRGFKNYLKKSGRNLDLS